MVGFQAFSGQQEGVFNWPKWKVTKYQKRKLQVCFSSNKGKRTTNFVFQCNANTKQKRKVISVFAPINTKTECELRTQREERSVFLLKELSNRFAFQRDVPQGSCFTLSYISKLFEVLRSHLPSAYAYADDTQLYMSFRLPCTRRFMSHSEANGSAAFCAKRETSANHESREGKIYSALPVCCSSSSHLH